MANIYYNPECYGLTIVGSIEWCPDSYEYDTLVVWSDEAGTLYFAEDSGCSCPTPFEEFKGVEDLTRASRLEISRVVSERASKPWRSANDAVVALKHKLYEYKA